MRIAAIIKHVLTNLFAALKLAPIVVTWVVAAEGLQHIVEWKLGMYQSLDMFTAKQGEPIRLGFGILKAVSVLMACYFMPKKLTRRFGPSPRFGSFNKDMFRKLWDIRSGTAGMVTMLILAVPLTYIHFKLSELAIGHRLAPIILTVDSLLIGLLALVMGVSIWASDWIEHNRNPREWTKA